MGKRPERSEGLEGLQNSLRQRIGKGARDEIIQLVKWLPILTVGETPGFAEHGGVIRFTVEDNRVRFEVNVDAAHQADLNISSRLLTLAKIIPQAAAAGRNPG